MQTLTQLVIDVYNMYIFYISQIISMQIVPLFGVTLVLQMSHRNQSFIAFVNLIARPLLLKWKSSVPPTIHAWIRDVLFFVNMEKIHCTLSGSLTTFKKTWDPFFAFVKTVHFLLLRSKINVFYCTLPLPPLML